MKVENKKQISVTLTKEDILNLVKEKLGFEEIDLKYFNVVEENQAVFTGGVDYDNYQFKHIELTLEEK